MLQTTSHPQKQTQHYTGHELHNHKKHKEPNTKTRNNRQNNSDIGNNSKTSMGFQNADPLKTPKNKNKPNNKHLISKHPPKRNNSIQSKTKRQGKIIEYLQQ